MNRFLGNFPIFLSKQTFSSFFEKKHEANTLAYGEDDTL
jgi:hypothetical protein